MSAGEREKVCPWCHRTLSKCRQPIDERFPKAAREALQAEGYVDVPTCGEGQSRDFKLTGWCWDRARFHPDWSGPKMTENERRGFPDADWRI